MSERGVFAVDRGVFDHPAFPREPFTQREAWTWLIAEAAWKAHRRRVGNLQVELRRGQLAASIRFLAVRWRWHRAKVERFLDKLKTETMVGTTIETGITIITICNYNKYQRVSLPDETATRTATGTEARQQRDKVEYKESKEEDSEAKASDASASPDVRTELFRRGLVTLARITGKTPNSCRSLIGRWLKTVDDEAIHVLGAIEEADHNRVADPVAWINRTLQPRQRVGPEDKSVHSAIRRLREKQAMWERGDERDLLGELRDGTGATDVRVLPPR
jgi:hypothetical protein